VEDSFGRDEKKLRCLRIPGPIIPCQIRIMEIDGAAEGMSALKGLVYLPLLCR